MKIDGTTRLDDLLKKYPFLPEFLARFMPKFGMIMNPVLGRTIGKMVRLDKAASMGDVELGGRFIHIRYLGVRAKAGTYRGCLEISQDVTGIRALSGEKRLLDWK